MTDAREQARKEALKRNEKNRETQQRLANFKADVIRARKIEREEEKRKGK